MDTRREFFKRAAMLAGSAGAAGALLPAIEKAASILPADQSTYLDAEHVVILMQENRSFDHSFGMLRGVRGFNDPRAVTLPNQNSVWLQTAAAGDVYAPFHLDAQETNATWLGGLPHSWSDQNDAKNHGNHDQWLVAKIAGCKECADMPLAMGYYDRQDLPFYYALADAFTICDQHFCSSLTGTTPNRLYLWSGTIREQQHADSPANVLNQHVDYGRPARWTTFPERLQDAGVTWKIYQNEVSIPSGLAEEHDAWLANFTDNPIEWFPQYSVHLAEVRRKHVQHLVTSLPAEIEQLEKQRNEVTASDASAKIDQHLKEKRELLASSKQEFEATAGHSLDQLPPRSRQLHERAFTTNAADSDYRSLAELEYDDGSVRRNLLIPKGDVLHQFRSDVESGRLPAVSWLVAPEKFSDHPGAPWYGAWYLAETMNILTKNPEVWKKTIFILTYDENDGFFDHVPPYGSPHPAKPETGSASSGIDVALEYVTLEQSRQHEPAEKIREGSIGLGFRVPLLIASPWTRGGNVCSQVFDHTSIIQFLEKFASHRSGRPVKETNITEWRRTVCGDLTTVFQPANQITASHLPYPAKDQFIERIHKAKFKGMPRYAALHADQIEAHKATPLHADWMPQQEPGTRPACALPYELHAAGQLDHDRRSLQVTLEARDTRFGQKALGAPFYVYAPASYLHEGTPNRTRSYAVKAGDALQDRWQLAGFPDDRYHLCICGPNGYWVQLRGDAADPHLLLATNYGHPAQSMKLSLQLKNQHPSQSYKISIQHHSYHLANSQCTVEPNKTITTPLDFAATSGWYDFSVQVAGHLQFERRYAGHIENGKLSLSDPAMGRV